MDAKAHLKRQVVLKDNQKVVKPYWKACFESTYPVLGSDMGNDANINLAELAYSKSADLYDSTLRESVRLLASAQVSGLTPSNSRWFGFDIPGDENNNTAEKWLDSAADIVWRNIHNCNFDITAYLAMLIYNISGMFVLYIDKGDIEQGKLYNFMLWPVNSCTFADSTGQGVIDTVYREYELTAEQAISKFNQPGDKLREHITGAKNPDEKFKFVQAVYPRGKNKKKLELPIASVTIDVKTKTIIRNSGYEEMPVVVPRHLIIPGTVVAVGPAYDALPDHKTVNLVKKLILANADLAISGMWGAVDDGVLNPKTVVVGARKLIIMANKESFFPLKSGAQLDVAQLVIADLQKQIRQALMADLLHPNEGPQMTAYEMRVRTFINRQLQTPMYSRLQPEYLAPMIRRCFGIAFRARLLGKPPKNIENRISRITYQSPMARNQKIEDVAAMDAFEANLGGYAQAGMTQVFDNYDIDLAVQKRADLLGVPKTLMKDEKVVKKERADRAEKAEQMMKEQREFEMKKGMSPTIAKEAAKNAA